MRDLLLARSAPIYDRRVFWNSGVIEPAIGFGIRVVPPYAPPNDTAEQHALWNCQCRSDCAAYVIEKDFEEEHGTEELVKQPLQGLAALLIQYIGPRSSRPGLPASAVYRLFFEFDENLLGLFSVIDFINRWRDAEAFAIRAPEREGGW